MKLLHLQIPSNQRCDEIDLIKSIAIISVILLHGISERWLYLILSPYHIWQAVPIFMIMAGLTASVSESRNKRFSVSAAYKFSPLLKRMNRILVPFTFVWLLQGIGPAIISNNTSGTHVLYTWLAGGTGPGSYFTPIYLQHLLLFPLISLTDRIMWRIHISLRVLTWLVVSLFVDYLCILCGVPDSLYRLMYVRYVFAVILGMYISRESLPRYLMVLGTICSLVYISAVSYFTWKPHLLYPSWIAHKAPAYFYTVFLFVAIWHMPSRFKQASRKFLFLGKASYHIFLVQMVYFSTIHSRVNNYTHRMVALALALFICCSLGSLFFVVDRKVQHWIANKRLEPTS